MFGQMKIKTRILGILAVLAAGYLLVLAMVQLSSTATHSRMSQISTSLFPAALKMQEAEAAFERMKKHYGDAVVLQDTKSLDGAEADYRLILENQGVDPISPLYSLAHLQLARVLVRETKIDQARKEYMAFLAAWKNADADLKLVGDARRELAELH